MSMDMSRVVFVSGHDDITGEEFSQHYVTQLFELMRDPDVSFIVADAPGCDEIVQLTLAHGAHDRVTVYHAFENPRKNHGAVDGGNPFPTVGGFSDCDERDAAMIEASNEDLTWLRDAPWKSRNKRLAQVPKKRALKNVRDAAARYEKEMASYPEFHVSEYEDDHCERQIIVRKMPDDDHNVYRSGPHKNVIRMPQSLYDDFEVARNKYHELSWKLKTHWSMQRPKDEDDV